MLLRNYTTFRKLFNTINDLYSITAWVALESWQQDFDTSLQRLITKRGLEEQRDDIIMNASRPWKTTALHEIQQRLQNGESPEKLSKRYQFLRSWVTVWHRPLDAAWIQQLGKKQQTAELYLTFNKLCQLLQPDAKMKKFLIAAPFMAFFKDWRDDLRRYHAYVWSPLFESIEKHFGLKPQESGYLSLDEIQEALEKGACDRSRILLRRNKPCVVTVDPKTLRAKVIDGIIPQKYVRIQKRTEEVKSSSITGRTGNPGKVRGKVFLLRTFHDIKRIPKGRVLVASTTHPNYVPAMRKSIAIVTDEGGIISHAAIVSRELGIPSVVGTKLATKLLKDNDIVEVDAEKGIVRKV